MKSKLQKIYKANQCSDITDCNIAIEQVEELAHIYGWTKALQNRAASLSKRRVTLMYKKIKPQMHPIFAEALKPFGIK